MSSLVEPAVIEAAAERIRGNVRRTPLVDVTDVAGRPLRLKCENLQVAGAFKIRGACNLITRIATGSDVRGVITYSSGNHAQAVACAARDLGLQAVVVMPATAPAVKVEGARSYGAEVLFEGTTSVQRRRRAEAVAAERGLAMVPPFDHPEIIAGQGTVGSEILADQPSVDTIYVPIGGGGLIAGVAAAVKQRRPATRIVGVEPAGAAAMARSVEAGAPVTLDDVGSIADGLLPVRPGDLTFAHVAALVDDVVTVEDEAIATAVRWLAARAKLVVEPSGAATVAAVLFSGRENRGRDRATVAVLSGGNIAPAMLAALLREGGAARLVGSLRTARARPRKRCAACRVR